MLDIELRVWYNASIKTRKDDLIMTNTEIIQALEMDNALCLFDPLTGETESYGNLNDLNKAHYDANVEAIKIIREHEKQSSGCEWCNNLGKPQNKMVAGDKFMIDSIMYSIWGDGLSCYAKMLYCPMCGRRLNNGTN